MLATQDVYDIEVPDEVLLTRAERLVEMGRGISLMQLMFAKEAAEFVSRCREPTCLSDAPAP